MSAEICELPAHEIVARLRAGDLAAEAVLEATLARIEAVEGDLSTLNGDPNGAKGVHAYISLAEERALAQARAVDRALEAGEDPGLLAGVPVAVKDIFCVSGTPSTAGSKILATFVAPYTATPVARLEAAGALTIGKSNLDEFTYGSSNESSAFLPTPRNPWSASRVPGGSSGGSAAAVAAGEAALSLGTDTSGSIRQPAAFCGIVGMKPTYGRVSRYGLIAFASSLDCPGPMARNVKDTALMLQAMAGADAFDATAAKIPVEDYLDQIEGGVRGLRIGLSPDFSRLRYPDADTGKLREQALQPEIEKALLDSAERLAEQGAEIVEGVDLPNVRYGIPAYFVISRVEAASNLHRYDGVKYGHRSEGEAADLFELYRKSRGQGFGSQPKLRILMGMYVSGEQYEKRYYERALRVRTLIRADFERAFERVDAMLAPTTPTTAFEIGGIYGDSVAMQYADLLTVPANHAGIPAISVPTGLDDSGLPIGMQLMGPDFTERRLLRIGRVLEQPQESRPTLVQELLDA
ncbi:MAG: Asp-tRNA(Asn)/Glu-tRNA(Gln) amidotransferase subunit GatA [Anaerolineae bacterium]|nr:MAG: Asp-tRNA(Asn)/Glu-tRNA(Gln) amidotransferase subunit GatA [Anaerolineae bacterium]